MNKAIEERVSVFSPKATIGVEINAINQWLISVVGMIRGQFDFNILENPPPRNQLDPPNTASREIPMLNATG
jgi:hypothetical protein